MDKKDLDKKLEAWIKELPQEDRKILLAHLSGLKSIYPFNEYEYRLMYLLDKKVITFKEYEALRDAYVNANPYLNLYNFELRNSPNPRYTWHAKVMPRRIIKASMN